MYDYRCKDCENPGQDMPMMNMPMMNMPMMDMPMMNMPMHDEDLKSMYPKIYIMIYPMVKNHCDIMISRYGTMYCPSKDEMEHMCKEVCDKYEKYRDDEDTRDSFRQGIISPIHDLVRILFIRELLGRRRRGRRRMRRRRRRYGD